MHISLEHYIATNNKPAAEALLAKYGVPKATSWADLIRKVRYVLQKHKESAAQDLAHIDTPYRSLILSYNAQAPVKETIVVEAKPEAKSGCCGSSGADGESNSGCAGCGGKCGGSNFTGSKRISDSRISDSRSSSADGSQAKSDFEKYAPIVGGLAIGFMACYVIFKK